MNNPEYCQNIYDAAQKLIAYWNRTNIMSIQYEKVEDYINILKRALERKEPRP